MVLSVTADTTAFYSCVGRAPGQVFAEQLTAGTPVEVDDRVAYMLARTYPAITIGASTGGGSGTNTVGSAAVGTAAVG